MVERAAERAVESRAVERAVEGAVERAVERAASVEKHLAVGQPTQPRAKAFLGPTSPRLWSLAMLCVPPEPCERHARTPPASTCSSEESN